MSTNQIAELWVREDDKNYVRKRAGGESVLRVFKTQVPNAEKPWMWGGPGGVGYADTAQLAMESADRHLFEVGGWVLQFTVKLTYFKKTGKFYSDGEYVTTKHGLHDIWTEVESMRRDGGKRPGLCDSKHDEFHVLVNVPGHPHEHPRLIVARGDE